MTIQEKFENWLNKPYFNYEITNKEKIIKEVGVTIAENVIENVRQNLRDNFIIYRYRFIDDEIVKEEILMTTDKWFVRTSPATYGSFNKNCYIQTYFESVDTGDNINPFSITSENINTLSSRGCYFDYENDEEVCDYLLDKEVKRYNKALKELERAQSRIKSLKKRL